MRKVNEQEVTKATTRRRVRPVRLIFLASPYSDPSFMKRHNRAIAVRNVAAQLIEQGYDVYAPIAYTHEMVLARMGMPYQYEHWRRFSFLMLARCDELWVLKLDGWRKSKGIRSEIRHARKWGIPIRYITPEELE